MTILLLLHVLYMLHVHAACLCRMSKPHGHINAACPLLHIHAVCPCNTHMPHVMSLLYVHAKEICRSMLYVHASSPCCISLLYIHDACTWCRLTLLILRTVRRGTGTRERRPKVLKTKLTQGGPSSLSPLRSDSSCDGWGGRLGLMRGSQGRSRESWKTTQGNQGT